MKIFVLILLSLFCVSLPAQNEAKLYSFFVAGHVYGQPGVNNIGFYPPFKNKFAYIQSQPKIEFGVLTGDIVSPNPVAQDWDEIDADVDLLGLPVYFAVGNHDMENRPLYESRYGSTYYHFTMYNDLFIVLDPNIDHWNISGDQLNYLQTTVKNNFQTVDNIYVFFHQVLWRENDNQYHIITPNSYAGRADTINFWTSVEPLFHELPNRVFMFAGDLGATTYATDVSYDRYDNITLVGSGMGHPDGDNFVVVNVLPNKSVDFDLICLTGNDPDCLGALSDYQVSRNSVSLTLRYYPNPARHYLRIELDPDKFTRIEVFDMAGRLVLEGMSVAKYRHDLDVRNLPRGMYLVRVSDEQNFFNFKLAVNQ